MLLDGLTASQIAAVTSEASEVLVIAPAGSGKTRVLTRRAAWLIEQGSDPASILLLTFTRKAAEEMRARLALELTVAADLQPMTIGTFHAVSLEILNRHGSRIGYRSGERLSVYDEKDVLSVQECVCRDLGYLDGTRWRHGLSGEKIRRYREAMASTGCELVGGLEAETLRTLRTLYAEYRCRLKQNNAVDYGLLVTEALSLLQTSPDVLQGYTDRIKHVLVDEFQDCDEQNHRMHAMFAPPANFFAVGDRRQSIYHFRGARPDLMTVERPRATIVHLQDCFRCGSAIVDAANKLIEKNKDPLAKPMISGTGRAGTVEHHRLSISGVAGLVCRLMAEAFAPGDIAVLARTHEQLRELEPELANLGIPYSRIGSQFGISHTREFKLVAAALRLIQNPMDSHSFLLLADGPLGCNPNQYAEVRRRAAEEGVGHLHAYVKAFGGGPALAPLLHGYQDADPLASIVVAEICSILSPDNRSPYPSVRSYWARNCKSMTVAAALRWHAHMDQQDEIDLDAHSVTLATVHAAKGLEWPAVIVIGMAEGSFPSSRSSSADEIQEERRVAYVALTRAREVLTLVTPADSPGGIVPVMSRFVSEAGLAAQPLPAAGHASEWPARPARPARDKLTEEMESLFGP